MRRPCKYEGLNLPGAPLIACKGKGIENVRITGNDCVDNCAGYVPVEWPEPTADATLVIGAETCKLSLLDNSFLGQGDFQQILIGSQDYDFEAIIGSLNDKQCVVLDDDGVEQIRFKIHSVEISY